MLDVKSVNYDAPAIAARVVQFLNNGDESPYVMVENLDGLASAAIRFQESDNGTDWTDIADSTSTVNPGKSKGTVVTSARARIALHAGGNVKLLVHVVRQIDGSPLNLGAA